MYIIIAFLGSPEAAKKDLVKLVNHLKKEMIYVDVVYLGMQEVSTGRLAAFLNTLNGHHPGSLLSLSLGPRLAMTKATTWAQLLARKSQTRWISGRNFPFGVDLMGLALTLRVSMEEQRQRQRQKARGQHAAPEEATPVRLVAGRKEDPESALLKKTICMQESAPLKKTTNMQQSSRAQIPPPCSTTREQLGGALVTREHAQLGHAKSTIIAAQDTPNPGEGDYDIMQDAQFLQSVLEKLPGVDPPH